MSEADLRVSGAPASTPPAGREAWLRGSVPGVPPLLQPVAHALLQALEDAEQATGEIAHDELWTSIGGAASIGFHLRHAAGSLDRLFTYARGEALSEQQRSVLTMEKVPAPDLEAGELLAVLRSGIGQALEQLRTTDADTLVHHRAVGRAGSPSTVIGLLFHGAEHTARHVGQVVTTVRMLAGIRRTRALAQETPLP